MVFQKSLTLIKAVQTSKEFEQSIKEGLQGLNVSNANI